MVAGCILGKSGPLATPSLVEVEGVGVVAWVRERSEHHSRGPPNAPAWVRERGERFLCLWCQFPDR